MRDTSIPRVSACLSSSCVSPRPVAAHEGESGPAGESPGPASGVALARHGAMGQGGRHTGA